MCLKFITSYQLLEKLFSSLIQFKMSRNLNYSSKNDNYNFIMLLYLLIVNVYIIYLFYNLVINNQKDH